MVEKFLILLGLILGMIFSIGLHEVFHYIVYSVKDRKPIFGIDGSTPFVSPIDGDLFYWREFEKKQDKAWLSLVLISGSGLLANLLLAIILMFFPFNIVTGVLIAQNLIAIAVNFITETSDGQKVLMAFRLKENLYQALKAQNYSFTNEKVEEILEKKRLERDKKT